MLTEEHEHAMKVAEQAYSAGNLVTCDGYYEFDLDAAAAVIAAARAGLVAEIARLREALVVTEGAIAEYYRYWTGGETRGSYDGKPERAGLWKAQQIARQAIAAALKEPNHDA